jgi:integrating conjugative element protein (TIGR03759 family)
MIRLPAFVLLTAILSSPGHALATQTAASQPTATEPSTTRLGNTAPSPVDQQEAQAQWGIDATEYARFKSLMRGPRGAFSVANISPLEVLGIHARTPQERREYADRLVRLMYEDTERVLAFEFEVQAAWKRLGRPMFDASRLPGTTTGSLTQAAAAGKRLALFVSTDPSCLDCLDRTRALAARHDIAGFDLYVTNTNDADAIRAFARKAGIEPKDVAEKRITLNKGVALFALYEGDKHGLPLLFVRDGKQLTPLMDTGGTQP